MTDSSDIQKPEAKEQKMKVEYSSNNSGGHWWLDDEDWQKLEKAGWYVEWGGSNEDYTGRKYDTFEEADKDRWLGVVAKEASKDFDSIKDAIKEFEEITGQTVSDEGCNCCGAPHSFKWGVCATGTCKCPPRIPHNDYNYASGEELLNYMFDTDTSLTKRELLDRLESEAVGNAYGARCVGVRHIRAERAALSTHNEEGAK